MNLMIEKTSNNYVYDIQTEVTAMRLSLIRGENEVSKDIDLRRHRKFSKN
jgi:hypothetical protein